MLGAFTMKRRLTRRTALQAALATPVLMRSADARAQVIVPRRGGVLNAMASPEPAILILGLNLQGPTQYISSKIYQGLLTYSEKLEPVPLLAKKWSLSEDRKTYTFKLQENVKFHDGEPMTADDVIFSIMKFQMEVSPRARPIFSKIKKASAPDPLTVVLTLDAPFDPFILMFDATACNIVPKHIYEGTDYRTNPKNQTPVGTGPFQFVEWQRGNFIRLKRFDDYWQPNQPYLDEIIFRVIPDSQSRSLALQTGQAQISQANDIEPFDVPRFKAMPNMDVDYKGWEYAAPLSWIEINHRVKPLDDVRVRQAMSAAIDRDFLLKRVWFGIGKAATGPICSSTRFYDPAVAKLQSFDPRAANQILDTAGYKPDSTGVRFSIKHLVLPYGEAWTRTSEYFRTAMRQIGIEVIMETTDAGAWGKRIGEWNYETSVNIVNQYGDPTLGVERTYVTSSIQKITFTNTGGYSNPKVDEAFAAARVGATPAVRQQAFTTAQKILCDEVPQIWMMEMSWPTVHDRRLHNTITNALGPNSGFGDVFLA